MLAAAQFTLMTLLFLLLVMTIQLALLRLLRKTSASLAREKRRRSLRRSPARRLILQRLSGHLDDMLRSVRLPLASRWFVLVSLMMGTAGLAAGMLYFATVKGVLIVGLITLLAPYVWLRSRLIGMQFKHRLDLLPAVESFYQLYVLSESKNMLNVLHDVVDGRQLPAGIEPIFRQLYAGLMMHQNRDDCLRVFMHALGGRWSEHLAGMLRYAAQDGTDISDGLRELIADMRQAIRIDHADRNKLLEIRIANFSPVLFLAVFLAVNFRMDAEQAHHYYVVSEIGRNMLLDALMLIGASFAMGIYLSIRRF